MIRIVLVDDHELVRTGFRLILQQQPGMEVVGEAADGETGLALIKKLKPDIALVDVHMPGISGIEVTERVRKSRLATRIMILTMLNEAPFPRRLLDAGASAYLTKGCSGDELVKAVRQVANGSRYLAAEIAQQLALENLTGVKASPFEELTPRELEVALMLAHGSGMQQIAARLNLSVKTIATFKYRLYEKVGCNNEATLTHLALLHGLLETNPALALAARL